MAWYPTPSGNESADFVGLFTFADRASGNIFFPVLLLVIWCVIFFSSKKYTTSRSWLISSFITMVLSVLFAILNLVSPKIMYLLILLTAIGAVWMKLEEGTP